MGLLITVYFIPQDPHISGCWSSWSKWVKRRVTGVHTGPLCAPASPENTHAERWVHVIVTRSWWCVSYQTSLLFH